jgi:Dolichyl-phosphate-mannose-protein mannosyltransferase
MAEISLTMPRSKGLARLARPAEALALGLVLAFALRLRLWNLDAYTGSFDEGIRGQQLLLMAAGYRPFRDIFSSQGPLLLDLLYPFFVLFGQTLAAARAGVVACSMVGLVGAWWVGRLVAGPVAGLATAALLGLSPGYLEASRLALAEVPTIAPALLAIGAALAYRRSGRRGWLVASAALCALALLIKPMVVHVGVPLLAILVGAGRAPRLLLYGAVVAVLCGLTIVALGPVEVWDNLGAYRSGAGGRPGEDWAENLRLVRNVLARERAGLFVLAAVGLVLGAWRRPRAFMPIALWAGAIGGLFLLYGDLADKHIVYLVPPLALLGGIGVGLTAEAARRLSRGDLPTVILSGAKYLGAPPRGPRFFAPLRMTNSLKVTLPWAGVVLGLAALGAYVWSVPALYRADLYLILDAEGVAERRRDLPAELDMAEVMRTRAGPGDWVLSDNPNAAFRARRPVIPSLVDTSGTRVDAGSLTADTAIDAVARYRPAVIVTWSRRLGRLDDFTRWLPENGYRLDRTYDNGWKLYVRS